MSSTNSSIKIVIKESKKPMYKPKKDLSILQKRLMKEHKKHHSKKHLDKMKELMLQGYCFQQAHDLTMKSVGK
tara:strand:- start:4495 stop:4713 length:219 start_codon:yes stop_codon:yes gene_type:complete